MSCVAITLPLQTLVVWSISYQSIARLLLAHLWSCHKTAFPSVPDLALLLVSTLDLSLISLQTRQFSPTTVRFTFAQLLAYPFVRNCRR